MIRRFFKSTYVKACIVLIIGGTALLMINNIISKTKLSTIFSTLNDTLTPIYFGIIVAFLFCPIYNKVVKEVYKWVKPKEFGMKSTIGTISFGTTKPNIVNDPLHENKAALRFARVIASIFCLIIIVGTLCLLGYFVIPQVVQSIAKAIASVPGRLQDLSAWTDVHLKRYPQIVDAVNNLANTGGKDVINWVQQHVLNSNAQSIAAEISSRVMNLVTAFFNIIVGLLFAIYLLNFKEKLFAITRKIIAATCSEKRKNNLYEFGSIINTTFIGFIVGRIQDAVIIGVITYVSMSVLGMPMALLIALIVGVTNIIPFFGPFLGAIPSFCLLLLESPIQALYFVVLILIIQQIDGNIIGPKIVGNAIGISSFWVLVSVLIGGGLFGFVGMALGVPVFAVIYIYVNKIAESRLRNKAKETETKSYYEFKQFGINDKEELIGKDDVEKEDRKSRNK